MIYNPITIIIGVFISFALLSLIIDSIVSRITKDKRKQEIIGNFIIVFLCIVGGIVYLAYSYLITKSEYDIRVAYWLIFMFILLIVKPVLELVRYKRGKKVKKIA